MGYKILQGSAKFQMGISQPTQLRSWLQEHKDAIGFAFVGRSNVGKSSLINTLFGRNTARVSNTPGRTREINIFIFNLADESEQIQEFPPFYIFDLPGYGHARISKEMAKNWQELINIFFTESSSHIGLINIQDARHPDQKADQKFHEYLKNKGFSTTLAFNKIDKLKKQKERAALNKLKPSLFAAYHWVKQIFFISAETKNGMPQLHDSLIASLIEEAQKQERANL